MNVLAKADETELILFESDLSISKAYTGTMLNTLQKADKRTTIKTLVYIISRMNDGFNMKQKLNDNQILQLSIDLLEVFKFECVEDVILMFKYARQGKIGGKLFKLDSQTIFNEWVPAYLELKTIERERRIEKQKNGYYEIEKDNTTEKNNKYHPRVIEEFTKLQNSLKKKSVKVVGHHMTDQNTFIKHLPETCKYLSDIDLQKEIKKAEWQKLTAAVEIYMTEVKIRIKENENDK